MKTTPDIDDLLSLEPELRRVALDATCNPEDADDVLQEMWLAILRRRPRAVSSQRAWLGRVIRNLSASLARNESARRRREERTSRADRSEPTDEIVERTALRRHLLEHVLDLDEPYRRVLLLRYVADMEPVDIAAYLGLPGPTIRVHCHRGLEQLRLRLRIDDPRRRRAVMAALAPWMLDRRTWARTALRLAAAAVLVAAAAVTIDALSSPDPPRMQPDRGEESARIGVPRRNAADPGPVGPVEVEASPATTAAVPPALTGTIGLELDGRPFASRVTVDAALVAAEDDTASLDVRTSNDEDWRCVDPEVTATITAGTPFSIALPRHGHYRVFVRAQGVRGGIIVHHFSRAPLERTVRLIPGLTITSPSREAPRARVPVGSGSRPVELTASGDGVWCADGPFFPGVAVAAGERESAWWQRVVEGAVSVRSPEVLGTRRVRFVDAVEGDVLAGRRIDVDVWTRDSRILFTALETDADGEVDVPLLREPPAQPPGKLWVDDARGRTWCLEPAMAALGRAAPPGDVVIVEVGCSLRGGGTLAYADGEAVAGADVIARLPGGVALAGRTDAGGRFELSCRGGAGTPHVLERARIRIGAPGAPEGVDVEVTTSATARIDGVPWPALERGIAELTIERETPGAPTGAPAAQRELRIVDEHGSPLAMIRAAVAYPRSKEVFRGETDHDGVMRFPDVDPGDDVDVRVFAPGRCMSLRHPAALPAAVKTTVVTVPVDDVALTGTTFDGVSFVAVVVESPTDDGRRHAFFGRAEGRTLPLGREPQRITVYSPGHDPVETTWSPDDGPLHADAVPAGDTVARIVGAPPGAGIVLRTLSVALRDRHAEPLEGVVRAFDVTGRRDGDTVTFASVTPGRYRVCLVGDGADRELATVSLPRAEPLVLDVEK